MVSDEIVLIGDRYYVKATATLSDGEDSISATAFAREEKSKRNDGRAANWRDIKLRAEICP